ncbi:nuclear RNA export factor 1-like [Bacillus rossius redtenbacheri]|uniref:nuclear RNA export factor 1-like n=1 Tax=Bacillus rossius redtenbacheri TaxID=93214 RepID=UPI002FDD215C
MPKRVKAIRNWESDFVPGREQHKHYYEHDDRGAANTRRVSFKPSSSRVVGKKGRRDWDKAAVLARLADDDVDMGLPGFSGKFAGRFGDVRGGWSGRRNHNHNRGRNSPMLPGGPRKVPNFPSHWYKVRIPYGHKYPKDYIMKALQSYISPQPLIPYAFRVMGSEASFCVDDPKTAEELMNADRKITATDGYKLLVKVHPGFPYFEVSDALKARVKEVMGKRYNVVTKALDLTNFHNDDDLKSGELLVPLSRPNVMALVLEIVAENIPELAALDLGGNRLHALESLANLHKKAPRLTVLHLGRNRIRDLRGLVNLKNLDIEDLVLDGNPVCKKFSDQTLYVSEVRKWLPKVVKLDGVNLPPPIVFDTTEKTKKPPSRGAFMCADAGSLVVKQFIEQYYQLYDGGNRQGLLDAYHDAAMFSLSCATYNASGRLMPYITESRNLLRVSDDGRRQKCLHVGRAGIIAFLGSLPRTQHDPVSFTVDLTVCSPQLMNVVVTGVFREPDSKDSALRAFARTFVIVPFGTGYCIVNEQLFVTPATPSQVKVAFQAPASLPPAVPAPVPAGEAAAQQAVAALSSQTGMNLLWSKKCLDETNWDFQKALETFAVLHKQGTVPAEAFIK